VLLRGGKGQQLLDQYRSSTTPLQIGAEAEFFHIFHPVIEAKIPRNDDIFSERLARVMSILARLQ
jgi:hypothetical protein